MTEERIEIDRIKAAKRAIETAIAEKDVTVPAGTKLDGMAALIESIEAGGGLPSGISALASGTFTPTSDTQNKTVSHGLGVTPNFGIAVVETDVSVSENAIASMLVYRLVLHKEVKNSSSSSSTIARVNGVAGGFGSTSSHGQVNIGLTSQTTFTNTSYKIPAPSDYVFKSGHTYRWVCGVIDGIN